MLPGSFDRYSGRLAHSPAVALAVQQERSANNTSTPLLCSLAASQSGIDLGYHTTDSNLAACQHSLQHLYFSRYFLIMEVKTASSDAHYQAVMKTLITVTKPLIILLLNGVPFQYSAAFVDK